MCTEPQCGFVQVSVIESCAGREAVVCPLLAHGINQVVAEKIVLYFCWWAPVEQSEIPFCCHLCPSCFPGASEGYAGKQ